jgi:hypothetical protein
MTLRKLFLDAFPPSVYNPRYSEVVSVEGPDREGCSWWKHPQENNAEVVWFSAEEIQVKVDQHGVARYSIDW